MFKLIILRCIVGAGGGLRCCRATEGSVEQHCAAVITPCQVRFAASCAGLSAVFSTSEHRHSTADELVFVPEQKMKQVSKLELLKTYKGHCFNGLLLFFKIYFASGD